MAAPEIKKGITDEQQQELDDVFARAAKALAIIETYDQARVDRLCQAVAWAVANKQTFTRLVDMGIKECGLGDAVSRMGKRMKIRGVLRDALRQKSMGVIEELPEKGIVKYAKPAGVIACIVPVTSPYVTPVGIAIYAIKCADAVIFSPHPRTKKTTIETVRLMRAALEREGAPDDLLQCVTQRSIPLAQALMARVRPDVATGGQPMVRAAYSSGKPAYGVGAGNATMVIDETANIEEAARNTRHQQDERLRLGLLGRRQPPRRRVDLRRVPRAAAERGRLPRQRAGEGSAAQARLLGRRGAPDRRHDRVAPQRLRQGGGLHDPGGPQVLIVHGDGIGKEHPFSTEKLGIVLAIFKYNGFDKALDMVRRIFEAGGKGHSCGIYSFDDDHIHRLALVAPVSRIMVRQVQSRSNAGTFTNGMPMTSSMGCGIWGGNITNENISLKHYMNVTWVSRPIPEDRPRTQELFGEFYNTERLLTSREARHDHQRPAAGAEPDLPTSSRRTRIAAYLLTEYLERLGVEVVFGLCGHTDHRVARRARQEPHPLRHHAPRAGGGARGRRLRARVGQAGRAADAPRAGPDQRRHRRRQRRARLDPDGRHRRRRPVATTTAAIRTRK